MKINVVEGSVLFRNTERIIREERQDKMDPAKICQRRDLINKVTSALEILTDRQLKVVVGKWFEGHTRSELADTFGGNTECIRQIEVKAICLLRQHCRRFR